MEQERTARTGSEPQGKRICRRCLTREMAGQERTYETIRQYIDGLDSSERADGKLYERRLEGCKACEKLLEGMCLACGCYVEIRAAKASQDCPYGRWKSCDVEDQTDQV